MALVGSYADEADFLGHYSEIEGLEVSNPDGPEIFGDQDRIRKALISASNYVNSKVAQRYPVPLTSWDPEITRVVCTIAMHNNLDLFQIREATEKRYLLAIEWLEEVRTRKAVLIGADGRPLTEMSVDANAPNMSLGCI